MALTVVAIGVGIAILQVPASDIQCEPLQKMLQIFTAIARQDLMQDSLQ
jgi:hypothetical protein